MKRTRVYGISRSRDKKGKVVKQEPIDHVLCVHTNVAGGHENMWVLVLEVYEDSCSGVERTRGRVGQ